MINEKMHNIKITNPALVTRFLIDDLVIELGLIVSKLWEKKDDNVIQLIRKPVYDAGFNHIIIMKSTDQNRIRFAHYLIKKFINDGVNLEIMFEKDSYNG